MRAENLNLIKYEGKRVRIVDYEGDVFTRFCADYFYPDDNEPEIESIVVDTDEGRPIEFNETHIKSIEILPDHTELKENAM